MEYTTPAAILADHVDAFPTGVAGNAFTRCTPTDCRGYEAEAEGMATLAAGVLARRLWVDPSVHRLRVDGILNGSGNRTRGRAAQANASSPEAPQNRTFVYLG